MGEAVLVDLRDIRELDREGRLEGAIHVPRGMLEFWFDPASPYHKESLADSGKTYVLFCAAGWRSALSAKTLGDMGFDNVAHVDGRLRRAEGSRRADCGQGRLRPVEIARHTPC